MASSHDGEGRPRQGRPRPREKIQSAMESPEINPAESTAASAIPAPVEPGPAAAPNCQQSLEVEIPAPEVEREYDRIARDLQRKARIPGFRPGKAPLSMVRRRFEEHIWDEVVQTMVPAYLRSSFEQHQMEPVSRPAIDQLRYQHGEPMKFQARFEVLPHFELADYRQLPIKVETAELSEQDVDAALEDLRQRRGEWEDLDPQTPLAAGDYAVIRYERRVAGEAEGEVVPEARVRVGHEETLPEFTQALSGARVGEEREFDLQYPADYENQSVAGKSVHFKLRIQARQQLKLPELNDDFARSLEPAPAPSAAAGEADAAGETPAPEVTLAGLRDRIRANILQSRRHAAEENARQQVVDQLLARHDFPVPEALVEQQAEVRLERGLRSLMHQGLDPRSMNLDWNQLLREQHESARGQVKAALILDRIAEQEHLEVDEAEIQAECERLAARGPESPAELRARLEKNGGLDRLRASLRHEKTVEWLLQAAAPAMAS